MTMKPIPQEWVKRYVDSLLDAAKMFDSLSPMRASILFRADAVMDMVKAFRECDERECDERGKHESISIDITANEGP